jgi:hypothetical protein
MVEEGGTGGTTAAPAVRDIYEAIFGVKGSSVDPARSVLPDGRIPKKLPVVNTDGTVALVAGADDPASDGGDAAATRRENRESNGRRARRPRPPRRR